MSYNFDIFRQTRILKNIYDNHPELKVMFTSSSALEIHKGKYDLSRRALIYELPGLSFSMIFAQLNIAQVIFALLSFFKKNFDRLKR